jgi:AAA ATPase-like protein
MGKSSLASVLEDEAVQRGAISLWGAAYTEDEELPYGPVARAIEGFALRVAGDTLRALADGFTAELACVAPAFGRIATQRGGEASVDLWDEQRMLQALIHFFRALSDHVPVILTLEDLQLANDRTIALLEHLARLLPDVQMLILTTFRSDQVSVRSDLGRLAAGAGTNPEIEMVEVEPLHRSEIGALAARLLAAPIAGEVLDIIADIAQGSPYYVEEAVWGLRGRRRIEQVNGTWQVRRGIRVSWDRNDVRKLVDAAGDFQLARKLRSV